MAYGNAMKKSAVMKKPAATKRYEPTSRILSLSFERDPAEHAEVLADSATTLLKVDGPAFPPRVIAILVAGGLGLGLLMELYRRYILTFITELTTIPSLGMAVLQLFPVLALAGGAIAYHLIHSRRQMLGRLAARFDKASFVDVDIFADGIRWTSGGTTIQVDWNAIRRMDANGHRITIETETFSLYLPKRAFQNATDFADRIGQLRGFWRDSLGISA